MRYNPALDGLRAVAILFVILFHSDRVLFPSGWIGVDVFFVLSGYLITSILAREIAKTGRISWGNFYRRRVLRLTPALLILAAFLLLVSGVTNDNGLRKSVLVGAVYLENWNKVYDFVSDGPTNLMGHTWSLATEEQFYLLWPVTFLAIFNRRPVLWLGVAVAAMMVGRVVLWRTGAIAHLGFGLDARPVGLLIGSMLALAPVKPRLPKAAGWSSLAILAAIVFVGDMGRGMVAAPLVVSLATVALILTPVSALEWAPAVYVGRISYGLYLYSFPIFLLGEKWKVHTPFHLYAFGLTALIFAVAALSYEFAEKPFLRLKDRVGSPQVIPLAA